MCSVRWQLQLCSIAAQTDSMDEVGEVEVDSACPGACGLLEPCKAHQTQKGVGWDGRPMQTM